MRLIIIGGSGAIGHALASTARQAGYPVISTAITRATSDDQIFDLTRTPLTRLVPDLGPGDCVYLLAAHINPDWVLAHQTQARQLNVEASIQALKHIQACGARAVFLSTELVFSGTKGAYTEQDPVAPSTKYGTYKVEVERYILQHCHNTTIARSGWVVTWRQQDHCPVRNTYRALLQGDARMATDNQFTITSISDSVQLLLQLAEASAHPIYHIVSEPVSSAQIATWVMSDSEQHHNMTYQPIRFSSLTFKENRPRQPWMDNQRTCAEFQHTFTAAKDIVQRKTQLLDQWRI